MRIPRLLVIPALSGVAAAAPFLAATVPTEVQMPGTQPNQVVALDDPAHIHMLKAILQHRSLSTTNRHYILASQAAAVSKHQDSVLKIRQAGTKRSKRRRVA